MVLVNLMESLQHATVIHQMDLDGMVVVAHQLIVSIIAQ